MSAVDEILKAEQKHQAAKAEAIKTLLAERELLELSTEDRLKAIAEELKALGYKRPRVTKAKIAEAT